MGKVFPANSTGLMGMCKIAAVQGLGQSARPQMVPKVCAPEPGLSAPHQLQIKGSVPRGSAMALPSVISKSTWAPQTLLKLAPVARTELPVPAGLAVTVAFTYPT